MNIRENQTVPYSIDFLERTVSWRKSTPSKTPENPEDVEIVVTDPRTKTNRRIKVAEIKNSKNETDLRV